MNPISLAEIGNVTGAAETSAASDIAVPAICTDTRRMAAGSLFIALHGENFDGHDFLDQAAAGGASAAMVDREPKTAPPALRLLRVPDTKAAMGRLARHIRQQMRGKIIAVAGSNGKTGTKHLIHGVLREDLRGSMSPKSFNNDIGVPLTIFSADSMQDYLVLELGTNHPGEIRALTDIALPDVAIVTNCSAEHLEGLGDLDGVRRENASLVEGIAPGGLLIVNGDDPALLEATGKFTGRRVKFGFSETNDLWASNILCGLDGTNFRIEPLGKQAFVPLLGRHSAVNALAAIAVGRAMNLDDGRIVENMRHATGPEMRLQLVNAGGVRVLNDAYNANPASMRAAIVTLLLLPASGRRIAMLGDMRELGLSSAKLHREIGKLVADRFIPDLLVCVGAEAKAIAAEAIKTGMPPNRVEHFPNAAAACAVAARLRDGDLILLKASRAIGLEAVARAIVASRPSSPPLAAAS
ncbi:MAG TPA: UDP-N-acetylmuramoyl-tripeptide--D-alanyl-D-alanine ligase [Tepidisphaeraceae bacterium]|jgi:UDP-N-acetylmuramoyl-tripeptide--D-alanyl-D-alanine ligase|nr:UDP-N-acetylmuramoyl-tripeptide--D-alanyl-D-alanine ligase [Tepidisphaeraceae bacterium]